MPEARIERIVGRRVWDSRGRPTVEAEIFLYDGTNGRAIAPAGASTGTHEAVDLRDGGSVLGGLGVDRAIANINGEIAAALHSMPIADQNAIDRTLIELDGTPNKARLGGNATIAVSMAALHAAAATCGEPLWRNLAAGAEVTLPMPMIQIPSRASPGGAGEELDDVSGAGRGLQCPDDGCAPAGAGVRGQDRGGLIVVAIVDELDLEVGIAEDRIREDRVPVPVSTFTPSSPFAVMVFAAIVAPLVRMRATPLPAFEAMVFASIVVARFTRAARLHDHAVGAIERDAVRDDLIAGRGGSGRARDEDARAGVVRDGIARAGRRAADRVVRGAAFDVDPAPLLEVILPPSAAMPVTSVPIKFPCTRSCCVPAPLKVIPG